MGYLGFTTCVGKTKLSGGKSTYSARAKHRDTIKDKALVEGLAAETGYSATIVGAVVEGMRNYLCKQLKDGNKVDFGILRGQSPEKRTPACVSCLICRGGSANPGWNYGIIAA